MNKNRTENYVDGEITEAKLDATLVAKVNGVGLNHTHTLSQVTDAGDSAALDVGTTAGTVAAGDHGHNNGTLTHVRGSITLWPGASIPSARNADTPNGFGPAGAHVNGEALTADDVYALYDWFLTPANTPGWTVTKTDLGLDESGTFSIYSYTFTPAAHDRTVMITSGHHNETGGILALWKFFHLSIPSSESAFSGMRSVRYVIIPCVNPYGLANASYYNVNNVNISRNYDWNWAASTDMHKGSAAESESETQAVVSVMSSAGAVAYIDCHNYGDPVATGNDIEAIVPNRWLDATTLAVSNTDYAPMDRVISYMRCEDPAITSSLVSNPTDGTSINYASLLGMYAVTTEFGIRSGSGDVYLDASYMTAYLKFLGNVILSYSQTSNNAPDYPRESVGTLIAPMHAVAGKTLVVRDAKPTTGATTVEIQAGEGQGESQFLKAVNASGATVAAIGPTGEVVATGLTTTGPVFRQRSTSADPWSGGLTFQKRGATGDSTAAVAINTELGSTSYAGWYGSDYGNGARVIALSTEAFTPTARGAKLVFYTVANGTTGPVARLTIGQDGVVAASTGFSGPIVGNSSVSGVLTIGSTTNYFPLESVKTSSGAAATAFAIGNRDSATGSGVTFRMYGTSVPTGSTNGLVDISAIRQSDGSMDLSFVLAPGSAGTITPRLTLDGSTGNVTATGAYIAPSVKITTGAGAGKILTSDADGDAAWTDPAAIDYSALLDCADDTAAATAGVGIGKLYRTVNAVKVRLA